MKKLFYPILLLFLVIAFFIPSIVKHKLPIPSDTIVGLYHPFRDLYAKNYPNGIPFKNFLLTDPVRQQYPWKSLSIDQLKNFSLPLWNPYNGAGTPLLANFQSGVFYPLNILFFLLPFNLAWSFFIFLEPLLAGIFMYLYLRYLKTDELASFFGGFVFAFCGFSISWMEWGNVLHTALWLPLILLAKDRLVEKKSFCWIAILIFAECSLLFAGHLQVWFYSVLISDLYLLYRIVQVSKNKGILRVSADLFKKYWGTVVVIILIGSVQLLPTLHFIEKSARNVDQAPFAAPGWFIPWQHLIQFVAPDFFGNPATLNYWGVWNYSEFAGYIGIIPLLFACFALLKRDHKETLFFGSALFFSLLFALPTFISKIPFVLTIPLLSSSQPTRLLFVVDFSLSVLCAFGLQSFLQSRKKIWLPFGFIALLVIIGWIVVFSGLIGRESASVAKSNLYLPSLLVILCGFLLAMSFVFKSKKAQYFVGVGLVFLTIFDLFRFGFKFLPFTDKNYLFPSTQALQFLQKNAGNYRVMSTDSRIFPPNFSIMYKIQTIDEYDPLYLRRYAELIAASERGEANISPPFGFNRIITPHNVRSNIINLLGVKYVLSFDQLNEPNFKKVYQEGKTIVYENRNSYPRTFFVNNSIFAEGKQKAALLLFAGTDLSKTAVIEDPRGMGVFSIGSAQITKYSPNNVIIKTSNNDDGFLIFTDTFYDTWRSTIDNKQTKMYRTDLNFRGVIIPKGNHIVEFKNTLF